MVKIRNVRINKSQSKKLHNCYQKYINIFIVELLGLIVISKILAWIFMRNSLKKIEKGYDFQAGIGVERVCFKDILPHPPSFVLCALWV